jgi:hypothetical protein
MKEERMRYLAIHTNGYGGAGIARPVFEIEADDPTSPALEVFVVPGGEGIRAAQQEMDEDPEITAGVLAWITGGQHVGYLAQKEDNEVVYSVHGPIAEDDQYPWQSLNPDSYWTGNLQDDFPSPNAPFPAGTMTASEVMQNHVVDE